MNRTRLSLNDVSAFAAKGFVVPQDSDDFARFTPFEENSQRNGVFNRLISALSEVWEHRMGGVPQKCKNCSSLGLR